MYSRQKIKDLGDPMVATFVEHSIKVGVDVRDMPVDDAGAAYCTDEGLTKLSEQFGNVPRELRAAVYLYFLDELTKKGYAFNIEQFKGSVH